MTILVTGGAGFIGSHLIQALQRLGEHVMNIDELNDYYNPEFKRQNLALLKPHPFYQIDVCNEAAVEQVFRAHQIDVVIHLGARAGVRPSLQQAALYKRVNVGGTKNLIAAAVRHGVSHFIFGSTSAVYGNTTLLPFVETAMNLQPVSPYAVTKLQAEHDLQQAHEQHGLQTTILRFFTVYGERGRPDMASYAFTEAVLRRQPIQKFGDGSTSRDYTYIDDIISGIVAALERPWPFEIINLGNHQAVTLNEFIATLEQVTGKTALITPQPMQAGDVTHTLADIYKAARLLDYYPTTPLAVGLERFVEWYKKNRL